MAVFYVDGQSIGNQLRGVPRKARIAVVYLPSPSPPFDHTQSRVISEEIGDKTNNEAEYHALLQLLSLLSARWTGNDGKIPSQLGEVRIRSDSDLLVNQVNGEYRVKEERLLKLRDEARELIDKLGSIALEWVPREQNYAGLWLEGKWKGIRVELEQFLPKIQG